MTKHEQRRAECAAKKAEFAELRKLYPHTVFVYVPDLSSDKPRVGCTICFNLLPTSRKRNLIDISVAWTHPDEPNPSHFDGRYQALKLFAANNTIKIRLPHAGLYSRQLMRIFTDLQFFDHG